MTYGANDRRFVLESTHIFLFMFLGFVLLRTTKIAVFVSLQHTAIVSCMDMGFSYFETFPMHVLQLNLSVLVLHYALGTTDEIQIKLWYWYG